MSLRLGLRAGLLLGLLRTIWTAVEHLLGVRTEHLEWVEPSYGTFLLVGTPLVWVMLWRSTRHIPNLTPPKRTETLGAGLLAGLVSGCIHVATFALYTEWFNPKFLDAFIAWNVEHSSNTLDLANREFRLPGFLDILLVHPLLFNPVVASLLTYVLAKFWPRAQN